MNSIRDADTGSGPTLVAIRQAQLVLSAWALCDSLQEIDVARIDSRVADLKLIAGLSKKADERMWCLTEILRLRSIQYQAEFREPPPKFSDAVCDLRPQVLTPSPPASPTAGISLPSSVGAVGNPSR